MTSALRRSGRTTRPVLPVNIYDYGPAPAALLHPIPSAPYFSTEISQIRIYNTTPRTPPEEISSFDYNRDEWTSMPKPAGWGTRPHWPPHITAQLLQADPDLEDCLGKYCWQTPPSHSSITSTHLCESSVDANRTCEHSLDEWMSGNVDWRTRFRIQKVSGMGYGLFSKYAWSKDEVLGLYLGEVLPEEPENTDYVHRMHVKFGGGRGSGVAESFAYIDAVDCGSYVRFCNHSCDSNAVIGEARVGMHRVLVLRARKAIRYGEQVCVDYGSEYFNGRTCGCGSSLCRWPEGGDGFTGGRGRWSRANKKRKLDDGTTSDKRRTTTTADDSGLETRRRVKSRKEVTENVSGRPDGTQTTSRKTIQTKCKNIHSSPSEPPRYILIPTTPDTTAAHYPTEESRMTTRAASKRKADASVGEEESSAASLPRRSKRTKKAKSSELPTRIRFSKTPKPVEKTYADISKKGTERAKADRFSLGIRITGTKRPQPVKKTWTRGSMVPRPSEKAKKVISVDDESSESSESNDESIVFSSDSSTEEESDWL